MKLLILSLVIGAGAPPVIDDSSLRIVDVVDDPAPSFTATLLAIATFASVQPYEIIRQDPLFGATDEERKWIRIATEHCDKASARFSNPAVKLQMLRAEERAGHGPDHPLRANSLSWWCGESAYQFDAVGDGGLALGPLQLHPGYANLCLGKPYGAIPGAANDDLRRDPVRATTCMVEQVERIAEKTKCRGSFRHVTAEVWMARGKKPVTLRGRSTVLDCSTASGHVVRLREWQERYRGDSRLAAEAH